MFSFRSSWDTQECFLLTQLLKETRSFKVLWGPGWLLRFLLPTNAELFCLLLDCVLFPAPVAASKPHYLWFFLLPAPFFPSLYSTSFLSFLPLVASPTLNSCTKSVVLWPLPIRTFLSLQRHTISHHKNDRIACNCLCLFCSCCTVSTISTQYVLNEYIILFTDNVLFGASGEMEM